jgi:predicted AAA+ superfamily ATPase
MPDQLRAPRMIKRHAEARVLDALRDTRIVALVGPRQSGKTTLARKIAAGSRTSFLDPDEDRGRVKVSLLLRWPTLPFQAQA